MKLIGISFFVLCAVTIFHLESKNNYAVTIPKSGTNLLAKALRLITDKKVKRYNSKKLLSNELPSNSYIIHFSHVIYNPSVARFFEENNYVNLFMIRDPRDVVVSHVFWFVSHPKIYPKLYKRYKHDPTFFSKLLTQQIRSIKKTYDLYLRWSKDSHFYTVRFEKLVGASGGGNDKEQLQELKNISRHCGFDASPDSLKKVAKELFGGTMTFREGIMGSWKKYFSEQDKELFKNVAGQLLIDLGYESDLKW